VECERLVGARKNKASKHTPKVCQLISVSRLANEYFLPFATAPAIYCRMFTTCLVPLAQECGGLKAELNPAAEARVFRDFSIARRARERQISTSPVPS
jgi:hypothetical protein